MEDISKEQIEQYKQEIDSYPAKQKKILIAAIILFVVAFILLVTTIILWVTTPNDESGLKSVFLVLSFILWPMCVIGGIILLILRYEIYSVKKSNRMRLINKAESIEREKEHPHSKDDKIGF